MEKYKKWLQISLGILFLSLILGTIFGEKSNTQTVSFESPKMSAEEEKIAELTNQFVDECKSEAQTKGYELDITTVREGELIGNIKGLTTKTFSCKRLDKDGSISLSGSRIDLRVQG